MSPFGAFLSAQRRAKRLTAEGVVRRMRKLGVQLDDSTLYNYEAGTVSAPDPGVLWALSKIYAVSHDEMIAFLVSVRAGKTDGSVLPVATDPAFDDAEQKLVLAFRTARAGTKRRILAFVDYEAHKEAQTKRPIARRERGQPSTEETALKKRGRPG